MEELIKRLERVIATGAPDKDGQHPISAEAVLEVVRELSEHGTNLAEVGTDCISRRQAIEATKKHYRAHDNDLLELIAFDIEQLPSVQPEDYTELKREFLQMASYIDVLLECSDEQKETLIGFISRLAEFMPWTERD